MLNLKSVKRAGELEKRRNLKCLKVLKAKFKKSLRGAQFWETQLHYSF